MLESLQQQELNLQTIQEAIKYVVEYEIFFDCCNPIALMTLFCNPIALMSQLNVSIVYFDEAVKQHDYKQFMKATVHEVTTHQKNENWELVPIIDLPIASSHNIRCNLEPVVTWAAIRL